MDLTQIGYIGEQTPGEHPIGAYFEAHIEQGPILEDEAKTIGIVQGVLGIRWYDCVVTGQASHAGPTPMRLRQDALQNCSDGSAEGEQVQGGTSAQAEISQGCYIERVTPLNFGTLTSNATLRPTRSTATLTTRCPAGTAFTLAMGKGTHASGNQRQLCNNEGQCLRYGLWQDEAATQRWGDQSSGDALQVTNPAGGTQNYTVYGEVPAQPLTGTGEFIDDVIITLTY